MQPLLSAANVFLWRQREEAWKEGAAPPPPGPLGGGSVRKRVQTQAAFSHQGSWPLAGRVPEAQKCPLRTKD